MNLNFPGLLRNSLGFFEVIDKPGVEELKEYYAQKYYQNALGSYEQEYSNEELINIKGKTSLRLDRIADHFPQKGRLLDVGCGEGFVLDLFKEKGWTVRGIDFSSAGLMKQNPHCAEDLITGDIFELLVEEQTQENNYEVIWLQNVLEHVLDPVELMESLRRLITPGGYLVVTVPNDFSDLQIKALEDGKIDRPFWIATPDHLSYFSADSLRNVGEYTGWNCEEILGDFPVDWFLYNQNSNYVMERSRGKAAHRARIELENMILARCRTESIPFFSALANIGMGRDLTAFFYAGSR